MVTTMRDIARVAGVSQSTVSRVLNDAATSVPIAADTRARVLAAAEDLGYRPNPLARGLRGAPTMLIGAVVRDFSDPFFAGAIEALAVEAMGHGYNIVLGHAQGRLDEGIALTTVLETRHTDAIVLLGDMQDQPRLLDDLRASTVPVVAMWQGSSPLEFPTAEPDDRAGIRAGLEHVVDLGHRRIAFVSAHLQGDFRQREDAYVEFMTERFGGVPDGYLQRVENTLAGGESALRALFELPEPPSAVSTSTDLVAIGVLHAAHMTRCVRTGSVVGRGLRRHPHRRPHRARPDDGAHADRGDGPGGRRHGHRAGAALRCTPARADQGGLRAASGGPSLDGGAARLTVSRGRSCRSTRRQARQGSRPASPRPLRLAQAK